MQILDCILLVDDDEITNFVHETLIEKMEITQQILVALNGQEALDLIKQGKVNDFGSNSLIILDINMPVMNGFEFLAAYHQLDERLRQSLLIVMLTSSVNPKDVERIKQLGVEDILHKPLNEDKLRAVVEKHFS
jgi:CheY-like chemotaxis protein